MSYQGIVHDLDEAIYHAHPALSSTQARSLLRAPELYRHEVENPKEHKDAYDLGAAVHTKVLGVGSEVITYPEEHLTPSGGVSTKAATVEWLGAQRASGLVVVTAKQFDQVQAMAEAVLAHPRARALFEQEGNAEASVFATDPATGVEMRGRFDFLPSHNQPDPWAVDLKTTGKSAHPEKFSATAGDFGYHIQQEWYLHAYGLATGDFGARMKFVVVETAAPHLVGVYPLSEDFAYIARKRVREALELYAQCVADGKWPGYDLDPDPIQPPGWMIYADGDLL